MHPESIPIQMDGIFLEEALSEGTCYISMVQETHLLLGILPKVGDQKAM